MTTARALGVTGSLFLLTASWGQANADLSVKISGKDQVPWELGSNEKKLSYHSTTLNRELAVQPCNLERIQSFLKEFEQERTRYQNTGWPLKDAPSVMLQVNNETIKVASASRFGHWLKRVPSEMFRILIFTEIKCR